jgi:hypothetical protein
MAGPRQAAASIVTYRLGGRDYPLRSATGCKVCSSPARFTVESEIVRGATYTSIARSVGNLTNQNVRNHFLAGHMPLEVEALRRLLERRAEEIGRDIDAGVDSLVDHVTLARTVVQRTYEGIASGDLNPSVAEGVAAARLLQQAGDGVEESDRATWVEAFMAYQDTARQVMGPEQFERFGAALGANPLLRALVDRHRTREVTGVSKDA